MTRITVDIDDEFVAVAMRKYGLHTRKETVNLALRHLGTVEFLPDLEGIGWDGDLDGRSG